MTPRYAVYVDGQSHYVIRSDDAGATWTKFCCPSKNATMEAAQLICKALTLATVEDAAEELRSQLEEQ